MTEPILVDTSVWINFFQGQENLSTKTLEHYLANDGVICYCPTILQEILQGCKSPKQMAAIYEQFARLTSLDCGHYEASVGAAQMYFKLKKKGISIRKPNDCLIAWYAIKNNVTLIHNDKDFEMIKLEEPLKTSIDLK